MNTKKHNIHKEYLLNSYIFGINIFLSHRFTNSFAHALEGSYES